MSIRLLGYALIVLGAWQATSVAAADKEGWSGTAGLGYLAASGNSDSSNVNANIDLGYNWQKWHHSVAAAAIGAEADGNSSAERYTLDLKSKRDFNKFDYLFGLIAFQKDRFGGVEQQLSEAIGYGRRLINNDTHVLNLEAGAGFRQLEFQDSVDALGNVIDGGSESGAIIRLGGDYLWNFSDTAKFTQKLVIEAGSDNTSTEATSAVSAKLREALSLVLSLTVKNNSDVPAGSTSTDKFTAVTLSYSW